MLLDVFNCSIYHLLKAFKHIESTCFWVFLICLIYNFLKAFKHMSLYAFECFQLFNLFHLPFLKILQAYVLLAVLHCSIYLVYHF
jgi:hypothetical protein